MGVHVWSLINFLHFKILHFSIRKQIIRDSDRFFFLLSEAIVEIGFQQIGNECQSPEGVDDLLLGGLAVVILDGGLEGCKLVVG